MSIWRPQTAREHRNYLLACGVFLLVVIVAGLSTRSSRWLPGAVAFSGITVANVLRYRRALREDKRKAGE